MDGTVIDKLWAIPSFKREYELIFEDKFILKYGLCLNTFLKEKIMLETKKYKILNTILAENDIKIFYGDDLDYFDCLNKWLGLQINNL